MKRITQKLADKHHAIRGTLNIQTTVNLRSIDYAEIAGTCEPSTQLVSLIKGRRSPCTSAWRKKATVEIAQSLSVSKAVMNQAPSGPDISHTSSFPRRCVVFKASVHTDANLSATAS